MLSGGEAEAADPGCRAGDLDTDLWPAAAAGPRLFEVDREACEPGAKVDPELLGLGDLDLFLTAADGCVAAGPRVFLF